LKHTVRTHPCDTEAANRLSALRSTVEVRSRTWRIALLALLSLLLGMALFYLIGVAGIRANPDEWMRKLPGDELIEHPIGSVTHAITIRSASRDVWPWLGRGTSGMVQLRLH
jgi:hypothetical protein